MCSSPYKTRRSHGRSLSGGSPFLTPFAVPVQPVLDALSLSPDCDVLELGEVACRFTLPIARYFATKKGTGTVYACELEEALVLRDYQKAKDAHLTHLVVPLHWDAASTTRIPYSDEEIDVAISISVPAFRSRPTLFASECLRVLRPGGTLFIAEWRDARTLLDGKKSAPELSKEQAWDILNNESGANCTLLNIPELEWAVLAAKPVVQVSPSKKSHLF